MDKSAKSCSNLSNSIIFSDTTPLSLAFGSSPVKIADSGSSAVWSEFSISDYVASYSDYAASYSDWAASYSDYAASYSDYVASYSDYAASYSDYAASYSD